MVTQYDNFTKEELISTVVLFKTELDQLKRLIYGSKSERFIPPTDVNQIALSLEVEQQSAPPVQVQSITYNRTKRSSVVVHSGRTPLAAHLPRVEIIIEPKEDVSGLKTIGSIITEQLEFDPGKFFVKQYVRPKYVSAQGGVLIGELPSRPIEKGIPGPGLLASITIEKYADHLPLYRQMERFKRAGIDIASSTMSDWIASACELITPLYDVLKKKVLSADYLQVDETPIKVLDRDKKGKTHRGYYWVYRDVKSNLVLFDYRQGRGREGPGELLKDFQGYLQTDGYGVYDAFNSKRIKLLHCMAHARRYFEKALDNDKERSEYALLQMQYLYAIERYCRNNAVSHADRKKYRQEDGLPVLKEFNSWLKAQIIQVTPKSPIGQALAYILSRWDKFCIYIEDGQLEIDNNLVENSIRPIAIGRKNYLFAGSHASAQRAAMIYSLLGTCKLKGVEPFAWLKNVFDVLPDYKANKLHELLP